MEDFGMEWKVQAIRGAITASVLQFRLHRTYATGTFFFKLSHG
jgi:hypothetical protein